MQNPFYPLLLFAVADMCFTSMNAKIPLYSDYFCFKLWAAFKINFKNILQVIKTFFTYSCDRQARGAHHHDSCVWVYMPLYNLLYFRVGRKSDLLLQPIEYAANIIGCHTRDYIVWDSVLLGRLILETLWLWSYWPCSN